MLITFYSLVVMMGSGEEPRQGAGHPRVCAGEPVGARNAAKYCHLLTPHFVHGHEMSFEIKCSRMMAALSQGQVQPIGGQLGTSAIREFYRFHFAQRACERMPCDSGTCVDISRPYHAKPGKQRNLLRANESLSASRTLANTLRSPRHLHAINLDAESKECHKLNGCAS